jgi:glycosyltransferase involved in cell wall biosynthesis
LKLSVVIPVYNETRTLRTLVEKVRAVALDKEIIIVNDGSTDTTADVLKQLAAEFQDIKVIHHARNTGKGAAVRTGIQQSTGSIVIIQDADLEYDPNDYHACVAPIVRGECKVVYGSRILDRRNTYSHLSFYVGGRMVTMVTNFLYGSHLTDAPTCYKTFDAALIKSVEIRGDRFDWEPEVTAKILKSGYAIREVPISYFPRAIDEGKHIRWKDGVQALWTLVKYRFG